jgi:signal transduction histidine kinase
MSLQDATTTQPGAAPASKKPTLLIVDDEAGPRESLRMVFKDRYHCAIAKCGREGIEYARTHHVDAAILDIKMPDLSGVEVLREIKNIDPNTECIMLTGYETVETAKAAVHHGAFEYLNKPADVFVIRDVVGRCMERRSSRLAVDKKLHELQQVNAELTCELAQSKRAMAAGMLSAGVVHEMNNPLSIISGYTELLARDLASLEAGNGAPEQIHQRLAAIQREIDRCTVIARRFLNFARSSQKTEEIIEVARLLDDTAALVKAHPLNRGIELTVAAADSALRVKVHPAEILQVLLNLCINSLQAMNGQGALHLAAERAEAPAAPAYKPASFDPQRALVRISITDTGCGIPPENLSKIFQPWFTTKKEGTGLGLAIICELIGNYGGLVDVQSAVGKGTTFSIYLPA